MKKTLLASAIALSVGSFATPIQALHTNFPSVSPITITEMRVFGTSFAASGTINSNGDGTIRSIDNFFGAPWVADQQNWFESRSNTITWGGTGTSENTANAISDFSYTFHLTNNQIAVGTYFDWLGNHNIPILTIYTCTSNNDCTGDSLPMVTFPFPGAEFDFNGHSGSVTGPTSRVTIGISGGNTRECSETGGSAIAAAATITTSDVNDIVSIDWSLDGTHIGTGNTVSTFASLGEHTLSVAINTVDSGIVNNSEQITVRDSRRPELGIQFIDTRTGEEVTEVSSRGRNDVSVNYDVTDICDPSPSVSGIATPVHQANDGDIIIIKQQLDVSAVNVTATAVDNSGNVRRDEATLLVVD